jgi:hypothetical protein
MRQNVNTLDESAAALHEMYLSYLRAGFAEDQAMRLIIAVVTNVSRNIKLDGGEGDAST